MANTEAEHGDGSGTIPLGELLGEHEMPRDAMPSFPMARRGYSTVHVDAFISEILQELDQTRSQLELAGREAQAMWQRLAEIQEENDRHRAVPAFEGLGAHIDHLLSTAAEESDAIRARAHEEATATVERARRAVESSMKTANERLVDADRQVASLLADAHADAEAIRREAVQAATKILARRDLGIAAIADLSRILADVAAQATADEELEAGVEVRDDPAAESDADAVLDLEAAPEPPFDDSGDDVVLPEEVVVVAFDDEAVPPEATDAPEGPRPRVL